MRIRAIDILGFLFGLLVGLAISATTNPAQAEQDDDIHISDVGEFYVIHKYPGRKSHKAIAVGPGAVWATHYDSATAKAASRAAVANCNSILRTSEFKTLRTRKCVLFDVDSKRTGKANPIGVPFGKAAEGPDRSWQFGKRWDATGIEKRGTMLILHGCNPYVLNGWQMAWVNYYRAAGFRVILPDSFAEPRDPPRCGYPGEDGADQQTRIMKLRIAQTLRTISGIRQRYAGEPLYLHGHSEGGYVAQALGQKVDGIIVTGAPCGFGSAEAYWVAEGVRLLVIAGANDPDFPPGRTPASLTRHCRGVTGAGKMTWISVPDMGHYAAIWWPQVEGAISKFLDIPKVSLGRPSNDGIIFPTLTEAQRREYENGRKNKAIAAHRNGEWDWAIGSTTRLDAEEAALFHCDERTGEDAFLDPSHMHGCTLVEVNGKRLVK